MTEKIGFGSPQEIMEHLREARETWSDEILPEIIHSDAQNNKYKVRAGWFVGVAADVSILLDEGFITGEKPMEAARELLDRYSSGKLPACPRTTAEDIATTNRLIDIILRK
jgi:hypothetical protein